MNFKDLLTKRKSCRNYTNQAIEEEKLETLKKAALLSPTGKRKNHWDFVFVTDSQLLTELSECKPHGSKLIAQAALGIVVVGDPEISDTWIEDCSIASILLQLQAEDLGLGSCWVQVHKREHNSNISANEYVKNKINIPQKKEVLSIIAIGYPSRKRETANENDLLYARIHSQKYHSKP